MRRSEFIELSIDESKLKANASRQKVYTQDFLAKRLSEIDKKFSAIMEDLENTDTIDNPELATKEELSKWLNVINREKQICQNAQDKAKEVDKKRKRKKPDH